MAAAATPALPDVFRANFRDLVSSLSIAELNLLRREKCEGKEPNSESCLTAMGIADVPAKLLARTTIETEVAEKDSYIVQGCIDEYRLKGTYGLCPIGSDFRFAFTEPLDNHLRHQGEKKDTDVVLNLAEKVLYAKTPHGVPTEETKVMLVDKATWQLYFGQPAASTVVPLIVAGFLAWIFDSKSTYQPDPATFVFVERQSTAVLADPAFASLREFFRAQERVDKKHFELRDMNDLLILEAFLVFGNPLLRQRLLSRSMQKLVADSMFDITPVGSYPVTAEEKEQLSNVIADALFNYSERRDYDMFRFLVFLARVLRNQGKLDLTAISAGKAILLFTSAAQIFFTSNFDKRYLRGFWSLGFAAHESWRTSVQEVYKSGHLFPNVVRWSRAYTLSNLLQANFVEPPTGSVYESQRDALSLKTFLEQIQKENVYT